MSSNIKNTVPDSWVNVTLKEVGTSVTGNTPSTKDKSNYGAYLPYIKPPQLNNCLIRKSDEYLSEKGAALARILPAFSVLVSCIGNLGRIALNTAPVAFNQQINAVIPYEGLDPKFLFYQAQSHYVRSQLEEKSTATTISIVNKGNFEKVNLNLAPINEQHRIVAKIETLFSELDKGIESLKTAREQLKVYRQAVLKHAFEGKLTAQWREQNKDKLETPPQLLARIQQERQARYQQQLQDWQAAVKGWEKNGKEGKKPGKPIKPKALPSLNDADVEQLGELPIGWMWIRVADVASVGTGITPLKSNLSFYADADVPWVTSGALNDSFVREPSSYVTTKALNETNLRIYPKHTLVVALYGEGKTRGKCSELLIEAATNQAIAATVQEGISEGLRIVLKWYLTKNYEAMRLGSSGGVQPNLNLGIIESMAVPLCTIEEANELASILDVEFSRIEKMDSEVVLQIEKSETLRQSILKKAFSGQLVPQDPNDEPASALLARIQAEKSAHATSKVSHKNSPAKGGRKARSKEAS